MYQAWWHVGLRLPTPIHKPIGQPLGFAGGLLASYDFLREKNGLQILWDESKKAHYPNNNDENSKRREKNKKRGIVNHDSDMPRDSVDIEGKSVVRTQ